MLLDKLINKIKVRLKIYREKLRLQWIRFLLKSGRFNNNDKITRFQFDEEWEGRIVKVMASDCNSDIPRIADAGNITRGFQKMHNGIEISTGDYYGLPIAKMLYMNKGVHEPEEEKIFQSILSKLPANPVMIEMGCFWAFYSMWFLKDTKSGKVYMIEPEKKNLSIGKKNLKKNHLQGSIDNYFIGRSSSTEDKIPVISLDNYIHKKSIGHINIAHADIQGYEMEMLQGASTVLKNRQIDYFFISTHTNILHYECVDFLKQAGYEILFHLDIDHVSSFDGFIVAGSPNLTTKAKNLL